MNTTAKMFKDRLINKYLSKFSKDNINDFDELVEHMNNIHSIKIK